MDNIMLDLETMGNGPNAAIVAIGAVEFDLDKLEVGEQFYEIVDFASSIGLGGEVTASTILWWLQQSDKARSEIYSDKAVSFFTATDRLTYWCRKISVKENLKVWGNSSAFDNVILRTAYQRGGMEPPWDFWNDRCYRTVCGLMLPKIKFEHVGEHHRAVDDAMSQVLHLFKLMQRDRDERYCI